jgi:hypothetical protein
MSSPSTIGRREVADSAEARKRSGPWPVVTFGLLWAVALVLGHRVLLAYDYAAGADAIAHTDWPQSSNVPRANGFPEIVVFAHPKCPCTRATIEELAVLMAHVRGRAAADVVFVRPEGMAEDWEKTDLWRSAVRIPGVTVLSDPEGVEAARFGAQASGQTFVYGVAGNLEFSGGITAFRGHAGDNGGETAVVSLVMTGSAETRRTSVYGCSLKNPERAER